MLEVREGKVQPFLLSHSPDSQNEKGGVALLLVRLVVTHALCPARAPFWGTLWRIGSNVTLNERPLGLHVTVVRCCSGAAMRSCMSLKFEVGLYLLGKLRGLQAILSTRVD